MRISKIKLRNFRAFSDVTLDLKPLTVLLGPNSSGKSSFAHPFAALTHCQRLYAGRRDASLTPRDATEAKDWPIDLGGYNDLATSGTKERVYISLLSSEGWVDFGFGLVPTAEQELWLSYIGLPQNVDITSAIAAETERADDDGTKLGVPSGDSKTNAISGPISAADANGTGIMLERRNEQQWVFEGRDAILGLDGLFPVALQHSTGTELKLNHKSIAEVRSLVENLSYLRASRKRPTRGYQYFRGEKKSIGYAGERTASLLFNRGSEIGEFILPPFESGAKNNTVRWRRERVSLQKAVSKWLAHLGLANDVQAEESARYGPEYVDIRVRLSEREPMRDLTEVGFGISQALPPIVSALLQNEGSLLIVDLPEAHLHPSPQGEMADLFCALAMEGRSALVETHSEMFFHQLRLRAAMEPKLMECVRVYFVDPPKPDGTVGPPRKVGLSFEEELHWPSGFLQEALDTQIQIDSAREARTKA